MELGRRGRNRRFSIEDEYWQLILARVGTVEACKLVGIGRKTGYRWRAERGGLPPLRPDRDGTLRALLVVVGTTADHDLATPGHVVA
jgi:hypothetical protein